MLTAVAKNKPIKQGDLVGKIYIAEAAKICKVNQVTFRKTIVEKKGWIRPIGKTDWGWDQYDEDEVRKLSKRLILPKKKGYPIELD